jgi:hypothetical protein
MARIKVYLNEEQERWVQQVSMELDESEAEVIRRVIDVQREKKTHVNGSSPSEADGATVSKAQAERPRHDDSRATGQQEPSREELIERIDELEAKLDGERRTSSRNRSPEPSSPPGNTRESSQDERTHQQNGESNRTEQDQDETTSQDEETDDGGMGWR